MQLGQVSDIYDPRWWSVVAHFHDRILSQRGQWGQRAKIKSIKKEANPRLRQISADLTPRDLVHRGCQGKVLLLDSRDHPCHFQIPALAGSPPASLLSAV